MAAAADQNRLLLSTENGRVLNADDATAMIQAGATRLGASAGVKIVQQVSR